MTRKRTPASDARVNELTELVDGLSGLNLEMARDMLRQYVFMVDQLDSLAERVAREGVVKVVERGGAENRHEVEEENKYFTAYGRLVPKAVQTAAAIKKFCKDNAAEAPEHDEFDDFLSN